MKTIIEATVNQSKIGELLTALAASKFAEACCIGAIDDKHIYLRCPNAKHGVIFDTGAASTSAIAWATQCLANSLAVDSQ